MPIKQWSPQSARNLATDVFNKISKLNTSPRRYSKEIYANSPNEIRSFTYKNVKVVYFINQKEVIVLAILHGNRNPLIIAEINLE